MIRLYLLFFLVFVYPLSAAPGDRILLLNTAQESAQARLDMIRDADEIYVSYFSFFGDPTAMEQLALLRDAAKAGKKVHLLVDGIGEKKPAEILGDLFLRGGGVGGQIPPAVLQQLREDGVDIQIYHPLASRRIERIVHRMHDKLFLTLKKTPGGNQTRMIVGSRNIGDAYFGRGANPNRETEMFAEGKVAEEAILYYQGLFQSSHVAPPQLKGAVRPGQQAAADQKLKEAAERLAHNEFLDLTPERSGPKRGKGIDINQATPVKDAIFFHDDYRSSQGSHRDILYAIRQAKVSIDIANPYVILPGDLRRAIEAAVARGVKVRILTNSRESNDQPIVQAAFDTWELGVLNKLGVEVWEMASNRLLHKKVMVVDGRLSYVGSFNMDYVSKVHNLEVGLIVEDEAVAKELDRQMGIEEALARVVAKDGKILRPSSCHERWRRLTAWALKNHL